MGIFEFRDDGALLRARQAQRKGLRDIAARTTAGSARHANDTHVAKRPPHVRLAQGHLSNARLPAVPWDFPVDMAGVGGVRATLPGHGALSR